MQRLDLRPISGAAATADDVAEIPIKRGPGRPKKRGLPSPEREGGNLASHADSGLPEAKRGRGRPRKVPRIDLRPTSGAATTAGDNAEVSIQRGPGRPRKRALPSAESEGGDLATHADHGLPAGAKRGRGRPRKNPDVQARSSAHVPHGSVDAGPSRVPPREELGKQAGAIAGRDVEGVTPHAEGTSSIGPSGSAAAADGANGIPEVQIKREPEDSTSAVLMTGPGAAVEGVKRRCGRPPGSKNKRQPILTASSTEGTQTPFKVEPTTPSEGCALLRLPAELRLRIYEFMYPTYLHCNISMYQDGTLFRTGDIWHEAKLMLSDGHTRMQQNLQYSRADEGSADRPNALPILLTPLYLTCRTLCYEVLPHLYDQTVFHFSLRGIPSPFNHAVHSSAQSLRLRSKPCQRCRRPTPTLNAQRRPAANLCSLCTRHGGWPDVRLLGSISTWPPVQQIVHWDLQLTSLDHEYPNRPKFNAAAWRASEEMHSAVLEAWMQPGRDYRAPRTFTYSVKLGRVWNIIDLLELRDLLRRPKVIEEAGQDGASEALTRVRKMHREVERRCFTKSRPSLLSTFVAIERCAC